MDEIDPRACCFEIILLTRDQLNAGVIPLFSRLNRDGNALACL
jgi:hypothetical protein